MSTLFEFLGIAGQERIHTQTLAWMLNPITSPLSAAERVGILDALGVTCGEAEANSIRALTEVKSLDLVVFTPDGGFLLVLENKLKSRQSPLQLVTYEENFPAVISLLGIADAVPTKVFLTLSKEASGQGWNDVDYAGVANALDPAHPNVYVRDYAQLLKRMVRARDEFIANHRAHLRIFERIAWSTTQRLKSPPSAQSSETDRFVFDNRLERVFVETLYRNMAAAVPGAIVDSGRSGIPLIQVRLWLVELGGAWYQAGLQMQGGTLKLTFAHVDYVHSVKGTDLSILDCFLGAPTRKPNSSVTKDYRSWSWAANDLSVTERSLDHLRSTFELVCANARNDWSAALESLRNSGASLTFMAWTPHEELARMKLANSMRKGRARPPTRGSR